MNKLMSGNVTGFIGQLLLLETFSGVDLIMNKKLKNSKIINIKILLIALYQSKVRK